MPELRMNFTQRLDQKISQKLSIEQKMRLAQAISLRIKGVRDDVTGQPVDIMKNIAEKLKETMSQDQAQFVDLILASEKIYDLLITNSQWMMDLENNIDDAVIEYLYCSQKNEKGKMTVENEEWGISELDVHFKDFSKAIKNPHVIQKGIADMDKILASGTSAYEGALTQRRELHDALIVADLVRENVADVRLLLQFILTAEYQDGDSLASFLREMYVLNKMDFIASQRLLARFSRAFMAQSIKSKDPQSYKNALSNAVGEFVLMSMGVIDQEIFALQHAQNSSETQAQLRDALRDDGFDFDAIVKRFNFQNGKQIFWHRYKTLNQRSTRKTDNMIRDFITKIVRTDIDEIYNAIHFEDFFENMQEEYGTQEIGGSGSTDDKKREKEGFFMKKCEELFADEKMHEIITKLITHKWANKIDTL